MRQAQFKKHLAHLNEEDLREELMALFVKIKDVKQYYLMELGEDKDRLKVYAKAKQDIASKYATKSRRRPRRPRIQKINAIISKLKKNAVLSYEMIDVYLYNAECALDFMRNYRFDSNPVRNTLIKSFCKALELISLEKMGDEYRERCGIVVNKMHYAPWIFEDAFEAYRAAFPQKE